MNRIMGAPTARVGVAAAAIACLSTDRCQKFIKRNWPSLIYNFSAIASIVTKYRFQPQKNSELASIGVLFLGSCLMQGFSQWIKLPTDDGSETSVDSDVLEALEAGQEANAIALRSMEGRQMDRIVALTQGVEQAKNEKEKAQHRNDVVLDILHKLDTEILAAERGGLNLEKFMGILGEGHTVLRELFENRVKDSRELKEDIESFAKLLDEAGEFVELRHAAEKDES